MKLLKGNDTVIIQISNIINTGKRNEEKLGFKPIWRDDNLRLIVMEAGGSVPKNTKGKKSARRKPGTRIVLSDPWG